MVYRSIIALGALIATTSFALAQSPPPPAAPGSQPAAEMVLSQRLMTEISSNLSCNIRLLEVQKELEGAYAKIKSLEASKLEDGK